MSTTRAITPCEDAANTDTSIHYSNCMQITPLILPDAYDGKVEWDEWIAHLIVLLELMAGIMIYSYFGSKSD